MVKCGNEKCQHFNKAEKSYCGFWGDMLVSVCPDFQEFDDTDPDGGVFATTKGVDK